MGNAIWMQIVTSHPLKKRLFENFPLEWKCQTDWMSM